MSASVAVVRTGVANLASVLAGLRRAGATPALTDDPAVVAAADRVVLPGVGAFGSAMAALRERGLDEAVVARVTDARPLLCICLGLQALCRGSDESPGVAGLGVVDAAVTRFPEGMVGGRPLRIPHFGWNTVAPDPGCQVAERGYAYFANSYRIPASAVDALDGWDVAVTDHGGLFVSGLERGPVVACQFHPELSGAWGQGLLRRWLRLGGATC